MQYTGYRNATLHWHCLGEALALFFRTVYSIPLHHVFGLWHLINRPSTIWFVLPIEEQAYVNTFLEGMNDGRKPEMRLILLEDKSQYTFDLLEYCDAMIPLRRKTGRIWENTIPLWNDVCCPVPLDYLFGLQKEFSTENDEQSSATLLHNIGLDIDTMASLTILNDVGFRCYGLPARMDRLHLLREKVKCFNARVVTDVQHFAIAREVDIAFHTSLSRIPTMGRVAAMMASQKKISVAEDYGYQEILYPELVVSNGDYEAMIEFAMSNYENIANSAFNRLKSLGFDEMGKKLTNHIENMR